MEETIKQHVRVSHTEGAGKSNNSNQPTYVKIQKTFLKQWQGARMNLCEMHNKKKWKWQAFLLPEALTVKNSKSNQKGR